MTVSESSKKAMRKYQKEKTKMLTLRFPYSTDSDIIEFLDKHPNKIDLIRQAIRLKMQEENA